MSDSYKIYASKDYVNEVAGGAVKSVPQELTDEEKAQARANIAAVNSWDELEDRPFGETVEWVQGETQTYPNVVSSTQFSGFGGVFPGSEILCRVNVHLDDEQYIINFEERIGASYFWGKEAYDAGVIPVYVRFDLIEGLVVVSINDAQSHTVSLTFECETTTITPIPPEYLPDINAIPNEAGVITKDHLPDLIINNAKLDYDSVSNAKIIQGTIQADRLSADAQAYLTGGPYLGISYDGSSKLDVTQGKHLYAMRLKNDSAINLNTWLINHATYNGEYLFNGTDIEGPMKLNGRSDFIGGIHGDEVMTDARFIVDGVDITNGGAVELKDAHVLTAYITSTIYDVDSTNALFTRNKVLTFAENKLVVENKWTYIGGEGNTIERWPACGLYPVYKDIMLGYTIDNKFYSADEAATTTPNMYLRNITFWAGGTNINIKALDGCAGQQYRGWVQHFGDEERPRVKVYFDTFSPEASAYTLVNGDNLEASFCVTVGGIKEHDEPSRPSTYVDVREGTDNIIPLHPVGVTHNATGVKESLISYTGVQYQVISGDESTEGRAQLVLGNNIPAGTAGNKTGRLSLYSADGATSGTLIQENSTSPYVTSILPAKGGVLLSEGNYSNYALPRTGGTVTGDITLNGGSSGLNYKTQRIINDSAYESRQALTYDAAAIFQLAKDNTVVNGMSVYEDQTKFSKPINVTGGSAGDNAAQTRTNLGAASQSDLNALKALVGSTAVADQIQAAIANITLETLGLKTEAWTLTMADGTTVTKNVVVV